MAEQRKQANSAMVLRWSVGRANSHPEQKARKKTVIGCGKWLITVWGFMIIGVPQNRCLPLTHWDKLTLCDTQSTLPAQ